MSLRYIILSSVSSLLIMGGIAAIVFPQEMGRYAGEMGMLTQEYDLYLIGTGVCLSTLNLVWAMKRKPQEIR